MGFANPLAGVASVQAQEGVEMQRFTRISLCALLLLCGQANAQSNSQPAVGGNFLADALARGDRTEIERQLAANRNQIIKDLMNSLLDGDTKAVVKSATACMQGSFKAGRHEVSAFCNQILARTYLAKGDLKGWSDTVRWFLHTALPEMQKAPNTRFSVDTSPDNRIDYDVISKSNDLQEINSDGSAELAIDQPLLEKWGIPFVQIEVNGQKIRALVDTGSPYSLILSRNMAERLKATPVATGLSLLTRRDGPVLSDSLALIGSVTVGPMLVKNMGVVVIERPPIEKAEAIVGLPLLQRFPAIEFSKKVLRIDPGVVSKCALPSHLSFATSDGRSNLLLPVLVDDQTALAVLDTGSESLLVIPDTSQVALSSVGESAEAGDGVVRKVLSGVGEFTTSLRIVDRGLTILGQSMGVQPVVLTSEGVWSFPWVGAPVFSERSLVVSFSGPRACLVR